MAAAVVVLGTGCSNLYRVDPQKLLLLGTTPAEVRPGPVPQGTLRPSVMMPLATRPLATLDGPTVPVTEHTRVIVRLVDGTEMEGPALQFGPDPDAPDKVHFRSENDAGRIFLFPITAVQSIRLVLPRSPSGS